MGEGGAVFVLGSLCGVWAQGDPEDAWRSSSGSWFRSGHLVIIRCHSGWIPLALLVVVIQQMSIAVVARARKSALVR